VYATVILLNLLLNFILFYFQESMLKVHYEERPDIKTILTELETFAKSWVVDLKGPLVRTRVDYYVYMYMYSRYED
jgi:hypothetical protein